MDFYGYISYWSRDSLLGIFAWKRCMSRNQLWEIRTNLHVDDSRLSSSEDLSHKFKMFLA